MIDDDTHDKLVKAYMEYFRANEKFESRKSVRTHREARKWLREIRNLSKDRMDEIHLTYNSNKETKKEGK
jgi:hypothetical protein